jgi:sulfoxide reductase heme-binding subunit YedZ
MASLKSRWRWTMLNLVALTILWIVLTQGSQSDWNAPQTFEPMLESGKWAIRFLLICLTMTPLHTYLRWSSALKLRKSAGLWAFGFALLHVLYYVDEAEWRWLVWPMQSYIALGLFGLTILTALALTSNPRSMRRLGKHWKRLHRLVYLAGVAVVCHSLLAATMSKKVMVFDPQAVSELRVYLGILVVLLVVRIPQVRRPLQQMLVAQRPQPRTVRPAAPIILPIPPSRTPAHWPNLAVHRQAAPPDDQEIERQPVETNGDAVVKVAVRLEK